MVGGGWGFEFYGEELQDIPGLREARCLVIGKGLPSYRFNANS